MVVVRNQKIVGGAARWKFAAVGTAAFGERNGKGRAQSARRAANLSERERELSVEGERAASMQREIIGFSGCFR